VELGRVSWPPRWVSVSPFTGYPPRRWPTKDQLTYTKEAITVFLLLLALPWLVSKLLTNPSSVLSGVGRRQVAKAV
jgi:hypothetical protein